MCAASTGLWVCSGPCVQLALAYGFVCAGFSFEWWCRIPPESCGKVTTVSVFPTSEVFWVVASKAWEDSAMSRYGDEPLLLWDAFERVVERNDTCGRHKGTWHRP